MAGGRTGESSGAGSGAEAGSSSQRPGGQSPPPKRSRLEPRPQAPKFRIPQSRWRYRGPKTTPPKDPAGGRTSLEQPRPSPAPEPRAPAGFESRAPTGSKSRASAGPTPSPLTGEEQPAAGEVVATRVALARPPSGSPSASTERARKGPSPRPSPGQAPEPLPEVLRSAQEVIRRLEAAVAAEWAELEKERVALVDERGRLEEVRKLLETRVATARSTYKRSMQELAVEREALEEARDEAIAAQEKADHLGRLAAERDQASRKRASELAAREEQLARREQQVATREGAVGKREETVQSAQANLHCQADDLERGCIDLLRWEEQVALCETDADLAASTLATREEHVANQEADLTT
ncbi:uncharacterized protein LOC133889435 [Phragmites australis]|uniref:uncharacterized protein LOC133889435 n=1 Tax=Phragmites australis TaxID=29695 RepID=UPI002D77EEB9|nr:uncharacterized protein LOC133889435 [Phragmites australis]